MQRSRERRLRQWERSKNMPSRNPEAATGVNPKRDIDLPSWLAYLYAPIVPYLKKVRVMREGPRKHDPQDILLPEGYAAEVVAGGFNTPVHCCFDDQGYCYVVEGGHKVEAKPRILKL